MTNLVPSGYSFDGVTNYPQTQRALAIPGQAQGVYVTLHPDIVEDTAAKIERWFDGRDEVEIIDVGTSDKRGLGFIIMEWIECEIDPLFLAILDDEESVADYTVYGRILEVD